MPTRPKMIEARDGPVRDLRRQQDPDDEDRHREEVEEAVGEDGPEERRARALAVRQMAAQDGDARELAGPGRAARRSRAARSRRPRRPGRSAGAARAAPGRSSAARRGARASVESEVEQDADDHPAPGDDVERVVDGRPVGPAPPDREQRKPSSARTRIPRAHGLRARSGERASCGAPPCRARRALVDLLEPARDVVPGVALDGERAGRAAHRHAARLVGEQLGDRVGERAAVRPART